MSWLPACNFSSLDSQYKCSSLQICSNQLTSKTRNNKATKNGMDPKLPKNSTARVMPGKTSWGSSELLGNKRSLQDFKTLNPIANETTLLNTTIVSIHSAISKACGRLAWLQGHTSIPELWVLYPCPYYHRDPHFALVYHPSVVVRRCHKRHQNYHKGL